MLRKWEITFFSPHRTSIIFQAYNPILQSSKYVTFSCYENVAYIKSRLNFANELLEIGLYCIYLRITYHCIHSYISTSSQWCFRWGVLCGAGVWLQTDLHGRACINRWCFGPASIRLLHVATTSNSRISQTHMNE